METSTNFGFYLPSRDTDDIADINQISDNFRIIDNDVQEKLESGTNIKTINNQSLLGSGNIEIHEADRTYSPTSPNAQSGIAVEEAKRQTEAYANKTFASAVRNTSSGDLVKVSDVSPIEHELDVKITSKKEIENKVDISQLSTQTASDGTTFTNNGDGTFTITTNASNFYFTLNKTLQEICPTIQGNDYVTFYFEAEGNYEGKIGFTNGPTTVFEGERHTSTYKWSDYAFSQPTFYIINGSYNGPVTIKNFKIGTASGESIVEDLTTVSVTAQGKNTCDISNLKNFYNASINGILIPSSNARVAYTNTMLKDIANLKVGETYVLNATHSHPNDDGTYMYLANSAFKWTYGQARKITQQDLDSTMYFYKCGSDNSPTVSQEVRITDIQIEIGTTATEYEPYVEPFTVSANADGTVKGLMSISPSMTLVTDTADITIDLAYNADTKMYIDNKFNELATALLNA